MGRRAVRQSRPNRAPEAPVNGRKLAGQNSCESKKTQNQLRRNKGGSAVGGRNKIGWTRKGTTWRGGEESPNAATSAKNHKRRNQPQNKETPMLKQKTKSAPQDHKRRNRERRETNSRRNATARGIEAKHANKRRKRAEINPVQATDISYGLTTWVTVVFHRLHKSLSSNNIKKSSYKCNNGTFYFAGMMARE